MVRVCKRERERERERKRWIGHNTQIFKMYTYTHTHTSMEARTHTHTHLIYPSSAPGVSEGVVEGATPRLSPGALNTSPKRSPVIAV